MSYTVRDKFSVYKVDPSTETSAHVWTNNELFKTSYFQQSVKNPLAMQNSTEQLNETKSKHLRSISSDQCFHTKRIENPDFINYDYNNLYRTTYNDMSSKEPKLLNTYYVPRYAGFVPGMKSENPFGATYSKLAKKQIDDFDNKRFGRETNVTYKQWKYNPMSRTIGAFWNSKKKEFNETLQSSLKNHGYTTKLRDSGFSENLFPSKLNSAWLHPCFDSDMTRTEYRIQYNTKKDFHYTKPSFNTGILKQKEKNYKHT